MGYRNFFASISKEKYDLVKNMSLEEIITYKGREYKLDCECCSEGEKKKPCDCGWQSSFHDLLDKGFSYELGNTMVGNTIDFTEHDKLFENKLTFKDFFEKKEVQEFHAYEQELYVVEKEFVLSVINILHGKINKYHKSILEPFMDGRKENEVYFGALKDECRQIEEIVQKNETKKIKAIKKIIDYFFDSELQCFGSTYSFRGNKPYNLDQKENTFKPTNVIYILFSVVELYRTFDFEKNVLVYYGC